MAGPRTRLCQLCARREGFGRPGVIPTERHNPMDLRHSPHSSHAGIGPNDIGEIDNDADGWDDAELQLERWAARGLTIERMVFGPLAPPNENDSAEYLQFLCDGLGLPATTPLTEALKIPADPTALPLCPPASLTRSTNPNPSSTSS